MRYYILKKAETNSYQHTSRV